MNWPDTPSNSAASGAEKGRNDLVLSGANAESRCSLIARFSRSEMSVANSDGLSVLLGVAGIIWLPQFAQCGSFRATWG